MKKIIAVPFLRNILILSMIASIALPLVVIMLVNPRYNTLMVKLTEQEAMRFSRHLAVKMDFNQSPEQALLLTPDLRSKIEEAQHQLGVWKVRIFDHSGRIAYSTNKTEIGTVNRNDYFHHMVAKGQSYSKIVEKESRTLDGNISAMDVAEVYVPILKDNRFLGAFEVYYDITSTKKNLDRLMFQSGWLVGLLSIGLEGAVILLLSQAARITIQRRDAIYQLKREKEFSETVLNSINEAISIIDPQNHRILDTNKAFLETYNLSRERTIGKYCYEITHHLGGPCNTSSHPCPMKETIQNGLTCTTKHLHQNSSSEMIYLDVSTHPIKDETGRIEKVVYLCREDKEYKIAEEEKSRLKELLDRSQKMETLGLLAGGVAHDLNNVLSGVVSYPDLLLLDLPESSPLRAPIKKIRESGQKAAAIVQDLLTLARRSVISLEVVNLNAIIRDYLDSPEYSKMQSFHPNVEVHTDLDSSLLNIKGSEVHLKKSIMNLVSNAAEALPKGGRINISTTTEYISNPIGDYNHVKVGDYVRLTIADNGVGIEEDDLRRIFDPFFSKKKLGRSGTGLGMSVVWGTVKDHNGYIHVASKTDQGTVFNIYFPTTTETAVFELPSVNIEKYRGHGESVLVVDDLADQRTIATTILRRLGYKVTAVSSGEEAVDVIRNRKVDLVILDMIMASEQDGLDTFEQLLRVNQHQKTIIASGYSRTDRVGKALALGACSYLKKPYTVENIGLAARKALDG